MCRWDAYGGDNSVSAHMDLCDSVIINGFMVKLYISDIWFYYYWA